MNDYAVYHCASCNGSFGFDRQATYLSAVINGEWVVYKLHVDCLSAIEPKFESARDAILHIMERQLTGSSR